LRDFISLFFKSYLVCKYACDPQWCCCYGCSSAHYPTHLWQDFTSKCRTCEPLRLGFC
jgi:hypothetical protein